jgi:HAE1 family hydrophobic/amphiphilic exporter-1
MRSCCGLRPNSPTSTRFGTRSSQRDGGGITLGQIAEVKDTYEKLTRIVRVNGGRGLRVAIRKQANANTVDVSKRILAEIEAVNQAFPQINIVPVINQGNFIERSIANVARSVLYGGGLAIVILLFSCATSAARWSFPSRFPFPSCHVCLDFFGGFTINLMTLGGLALGVGMMVDSSIVVLENIFRRRNENGEAPRKHRWKAPGRWGRPSSPAPSPRWSFFCR